MDQVEGRLGIYDAPATRNVADFIGSANTFEGKAHGGRFQIAPGVEVASPLDAAVVAIVRPENLQVEPSEGVADREWCGRVEFVRALGSIVEYEIGFPGKETVRALALAPDVAERTFRTAFASFPAVGPGNVGA